MKKYFVTGIGTDVGKTLISAILAEALKADYWKPIQAGNYLDTDSKKILDLITNTETVIHPESYLFTNAASPHTAAELEGKQIVFDDIITPKTDKPLIIEGAGGVMVPLNWDYFIIDLIKKLDAEVIVVIQNYLGSINHALLTIDALKHKGIKIKGLVFNGSPHKMSEDIIFKYSGCEEILRVFTERKVNKEMILKYADKVDISIF